MARLLGAVTSGGHVRVGLDDIPIGSNKSQWSNATLVEAAVGAASLSGRRVATASEARAMLGLASWSPASSEGDTRSALGLAEHSVEQGPSTLFVGWPPHADASPGS